MAAFSTSSAPPKPDDRIVYELREVPPGEVAQVVDDFLSETPATIEKLQQPNGAFTVRVRRASPEER